MPKGNNQPIKKVNIKMKISLTQTKDFINTLKERFENNTQRHRGLQWENIFNKFKSDKKKIVSLYAMENTGGEPDVIGFDSNTGEYFYCDCSEQSPWGRRNICYDHAGQKERENKKVYPAGNADDLANEMSVELLNEDQYRNLQQLGVFDTTTSSWLKTPPEIRKNGGAIFADRRYSHVFVYHNSAPTFYSARGFRGLLRV